MCKVKSLLVLHLTWDLRSLSCAFKEAALILERQQWLVAWSKLLIPCPGIEPGYAGEGNGTPLQYSCLENPIDGAAWWAAVHGVAKSRAGLSDFTFTFHFPVLEKAMATHSSVLAWRIPGTGEPRVLPSTGSHRVRYNWSDLAAAAAAACWMKTRNLVTRPERVRG